MPEQFQTIVFLVRHGQSDGFKGQGENSDKQRNLSEEGRAQAKKMGEYLREFAPTAIYSSPLERTMATAEIIQKVAEIPGEISQKNELAEVYSAADHAARPDEEKGLIKQIVQAHRGEQVVVVSHQYPIEVMLKDWGFSADEIAGPCRMGQGYRLVFAGDTPVECLKINPAQIT